MLLLRTKLLRVARIALVLLVAAAAGRAQQAAPRAGAAVPERAAQQAPAAINIPQARPLRTTHRFWDRTNDLLFSGVAATRGLDYSSTLKLRRRGLDEILLTNSVVDNHALFAGIEVAATAVSIGVSYVFHRTGHHKLERWTSIVHFSAAAGGAARNYALKTQQASAM
jgi:hypothetical protein